MEIEQVQYASDFYMFESEHVFSWNHSAALVNLSNVSNFWDWLAGPTQE